MREAKGMALLLGPPILGKTTLLLALAGRLGEMTIRETLAFFARCQGIETRYEMLAELLRRQKAANIKPDLDLDIYMKILGTKVCADTMIGDVMIQGIFGGQKKRVTTTLLPQVGPTRALFMDEISTELDSSTIFQMINSLRQSIHILNGTIMIYLLQPAPETYELFDDIIIRSDGQIVYQHPRENVLKFFEYMGLKCLERKGITNFLQGAAVTLVELGEYARTDSLLDDLTKDLR
ncbi:Pleiotropic drug resistance protein TUR2 [Glycine soja]